jgi:hypothetical protein
MSKNQHILTICGNRAIWPIGFKQWRNVFRLNCNDKWDNSADNDRTISLTDELKIGAI